MAKDPCSESLQALVDIFNIMLDDAAKTCEAKVHLYSKPKVQVEEGRTEHDRYLLEHKINLTDKELDQFEKLEYFKPYREYIKKHGSLTKAQAKGVKFELDKWNKPPVGRKAKG